MLPTAGDDRNATGGAGGGGDGGNVTATSSTRRHAARMSARSSDLVISLGCVYALHSGHAFRLCMRARTHTLQNEWPHRNDTGSTYIAVHNRHVSSDLITANCCASTALNTLGSRIFQK